MLPKIRELLAVERTARGWRCTRYQSQDALVSTVKRDDPGAADRIKEDCVEAKGSATGYKRIAVLLRAKDGSATTRRVRRIYREENT